MNKTYEQTIEEMEDYTYQWLPENYGNEDEPILKITKSSLGTYQWCPKKYEFSYIERRPQDQTEAMRKGTYVHNAREAFFDEFDIKKAEDMNEEELLDYCSSLFPIDEYSDLYMTIASFEAQRFTEAKADGELHQFLPIVNEGKFDAEFIFLKDLSKKYPLSRDYKIHLQGIIDRVFIDNGNLIPFELKTGAWKDYKVSSMRKEMAFYQLLIENCPDEVLKENNLTRDMAVTHWGWYYPASNYVFVEPRKNRTMTSIYDSIAKLLLSYEQKRFEEKFYAKTCQHCSFYGVCSDENGLGF